MALYAFDGTWNRRDRQDELFVDRTTIPDQYGRSVEAGRDTIETNVHRFMELFDPERAETMYQEGVGTKARWLGGSIWGGAFGFGAKRRIRKAYRALMHRYHDEGDEHIDVIGFSRGAGMAVHFTNVIKRYGVRDPRGGRELGLRYHWGLGFTWRFPKSGARWPDDVVVRPQKGVTPDLCSGPRVCFLGLWDTVGSFGWPMWPLRNRMPGMTIDSIPDVVGFTCHAMALDEQRKTFELVDLAVDRPGVPDGEKRYFLYELWFRGVHSNVGGGYADRGLSDISLEWMMEMARFHWRRQGHEREFPGREHQARRPVSESLEPNPNGELGRPADPRRSGFRTITQGRRLVHHTAFARQPDKLSDYDRSHRVLVRRLPANAVPVWDPPLPGREGTLGQVVDDLLSSLYYRVPVEPQPWLVSGRVRRHDDRLDIDRGSDEERRIGKEAFTAVAEHWLMGRGWERGSTVEVAEADRATILAILGAMAAQGLVPFSSELTLHRIGGLLEQYLGERDR